MATDRVTRWRLFCPVEREHKYLSQRAYRAEVENNQWDFTCPTCGVSIPDLDRDWLQNGFREWWIKATPSDQQASQDATLGLQEGTTDDDRTQRVGDGGDDTLEIAPGDGNALAPGSPGFCGPH